MSDNTEPQYYTIEEAAAKVGLSKTYVRTLIRKGAVRTERRPIGPQSSVWKHMIPETELDNLRDRKNGRAKRDDGRRKYLWYLTDEEVVALKELLAGTPLEHLYDHMRLPKPSNPYQERKRRAVRKVLQNASN